MGFLGCSVVNERIPGCFEVISLISDDAIRCTSMNFMVMMDSCLPMHTRGPSPKGMKHALGRFCLKRGRKRSGMKLSG